MSTRLAPHPIRTLSHAALAVALVGLVHLLPVGCRSVPADGEVRRLQTSGRLERARQLLETNGVDDAIDALEDLLDDASPDLVPDVHVLLGVARARDGDVTGGIDETERAVALAPGRADLQDALGSMLAAAGRQRDALAAWDQALRLDSDRSETWFNVGRLRLDRGEERGAIRAFTEAIQRRPADAEARTLLGEAYRRLGRLDEARGAITSAEEVTGPSASTRMSLAAMALDEGDLDRARELLEEAALLDPTDPLPPFNLGVLEEVRERPDAAREAYEIAVSRDETFVPALGNLAQLLWDDGEYANARDRMRRAVALETDPDRRARLARRLRAMERTGAPPPPRTAVPGVLDPEAAARDVEPR